jgi:cytoskeletal protein RodZ
MPDFTRKKIQPKSLGEILKATRNKKGLTLDQVEEETKVRAKYLEALENEHFENLPGDVYALGFLTKYLDFLELDKNELLTQFKMERGKSFRAGKFMPTTRNYEPKFSITPRFLVIIIVILVILGIIGYIGYSVRSFMLPPNLQISSPSTSQIITESKVNIIGKTDLGATLMINNQLVLLDGNGNFSQEVKLNPGLNTFEVIATNRLKKQTNKEIKILAQY